MPMKMLTLNVNGVEYEVKASVTATLADVLREELGLTGTNIMCNEGECGACTVLINGRPVLSCMLFRKTNYLEVHKGCDKAKQRNRQMRRAAGSPHTRRP